MFNINIDVGKNNAEEAVVNEVKEENALEFNLVS